jgi:hypothetical protein
MTPVVGSISTNETLDGFICLCRPYMVMPNWPKEMDGSKTVLINNLKIRFLGVNNFEFIVV